MTSQTVFEAGSTALITGSASGIGLALAKHCYRGGMNVVLADRDSGALQSAEAEVQKEKVSGGSAGKVLAETVDVSKLEDWAALKKSVGEAFGSVELLALNAGTGIRDRSWGDDAYFREVRGPERIKTGEFLPHFLLAMDL